MRSTGVTCTVHGDKGVPGRGSLTGQLCFAQGACEDHWLSAISSISHSLGLGIDYLLGGPGNNLLICHLPLPASSTNYPPICSPKESLQPTSQNWPLAETFRSKIHLHRPKTLISCLCSPSPYSTVALKLTLIHQNDATFHGTMLCTCCFISLWFYNPQPSPPLFYLAKPLNMCVSPCIISTGPIFRRKCGSSALASTWRTYNMAMDAATFELVLSAVGLA